MVSIAVALWFAGLLVWLVLLVAGIWLAIRISKKYGKEKV